MADLAAETLVSPDFVSLSAQGVESFQASNPIYYMRAEANPGPGYVFWIAPFADYTGIYATALFQANTVVLLVPVCS
jgi:hypothetical protein